MSINNMPKGKFIAFDGIDGCGKSSQIKLATKYLFEKDKKNHIVLTREPALSTYMIKIREILASAKDPKGQKETLTELFVKDRKDHIARLIKPALDYGCIVISDRYKFSTLAYQQTQGMPLNKLMELHKGLLVPDLTIIFDVSAEIGCKRSHSDESRSKLEVFEKHIAFQEELRQNYLKFKEQLPDENIVIVDATKPVEDVFNDVKKEINKIF